EVRTRGAADDIDRIAGLVNTQGPAVVIAAGGDGTVSDVVEAIMRGAPGAAPALGILPLGTANNVARSLGLHSIRQRGAVAVELAVETIAGRHERRIDVGRVDCGQSRPARYFVGSVAVGMDGDILHTRNRLRRQLRLGPRLGGYPLYLWSCALNLMR